MGFFFGHHFSVARKLLARNSRGLVSPRVGRTKSSQANNLHIGRGFFSGRKTLQRRWMRVLLNQSNRCHRPCHTPAAHSVGPCRTYQPPPPRVSSRICLFISKHCCPYFGMPFVSPLHFLGREQEKESEFHYACEWILFGKNMRACVYVCVRACTYGCKWIWCKLQFYAYFHFVCAARPPPVFPSSCFCFSVAVSAPVCPAAVSCCACNW